MNDAADRLFEPQIPGESGPDGSNLMSPGRDSRPLFSRILHLSTMLRRQLYLAASVSAHTPFSTADSSQLEHLRAPKQEAANHARFAASFASLPRSGLELARPIDHRLHRTNDVIGCTRSVYLSGTDV